MSMEKPLSSRSTGTLAGEIVAGHELLRLLAVGGMGEVYLAKHQALGMIRAVKLIRADLRARDKSLQRFTREAQVLARLQHNAIVQIIEFGSLASGWPFLVMEYIEGPGLDELVASAPFSIPSTLVVLEQMALALHHAHSNNVIHRDLKPSNVLLRLGDVRQVKMIDFGLARVLDAEGERLTADGQMIGSPTYMAPEQIDGGRDVSAAVDVYALAGIAYLLASGYPPFLHKKPVRLMAAHVKELPPRLSERCAGVPEPVDELLFSCLAKNPAHRPGADELATQIGMHLRGTQLDARQPVARTSIELVGAEWVASVDGPDLATRLLDTPVPRDPDGRGVALATRIMSMIEEIATYLSASDPELTSLLRLEARICEQLANVERDLAAITAQLEYTPGVPGLVKQREALVERIRTLNVQQLPLQRRMVHVVEAYRRYASGSIGDLFRQMDRTLHELEALRRRFS